MSRVKNRLLKFKELPWAKKRLLVTTASLFFAARIALRPLGFRRTHRLVATLAAISLPHTGDAISFDDILWSVAAGRRLVPHTLLVEYGHSARLQIGVRRSETSEIEAHAWVESQGKIVVGAVQGSPQFLPFSHLQIGIL